MACLMLLGAFGGTVRATEWSESVPENTDSDGNVPTDAPEVTENEATESAVQEGIPSATAATVPSETSVEHAETAEPEANESTTGTIEVPEVTEPEVTVPEVTEPEISPLDNELEVGDTLVPAYMLDSNQSVLMSAGQKVTITRKVHFNIPETDYWWRSSLMDYKNGRWWTASGLYFELSDGRIGFCIQPSYDGPSGDVSSLQPGEQYVDSEGWPAALSYSNGGVDTWFIDQISKTAVARILAIGAPNNGDRTSAALEATALAIWDAITGYMNPNGTWRWGMTSGAFYANTWGTRDEEYKKILNALAHFDDIPSFASRNPANVPTYELTYHPDSNVYDVLLTDTNGVLANKFNFVVPGDLQREIILTKHGNSLRVTVTPKGVEALKNGECMIQNRNCGIEVGANACTVYGNGLRTQKLVVLDRPIDPIPCYFRIHAEPKGGTLKIVKSTNTGTNLDGWRFGIYTDSGCTNPVSGSPFTTNSNGLITTDLDAGTYYVKELDSSLDYWYTDNTVKSVTVSNGSTASVNFHNRHHGKVEIRKATNTGGSLGGWQFGIYTDSGCNNPVSGSPFTTNDSGLIATDLAAGTYYVKEITPSSGYWEVDSAVKSVTVSNGATASISFRNTQYGRLKVTKNAINGSAKDWIFDVYDSGGSLVSTLTTSSSGTSTSGNLLPGTYTVRERHDENRDYYWTYDVEYEKTVEIHPGATADISFTNTENGRIRIQKALETDGHFNYPLNTWQFEIRDASGDPIAGSPFCTDGSGQIITGQLAPGTYTVEEILPADSLFFCKTEGEVTVTVVNGETAEVSFTNTLRPGEISILKLDQDGNPLADARFQLEWSEDDGASWHSVFKNDQAYVVTGGCSNASLTDHGTLVTEADGMATFTGLHPELTYRLTETEAPAGYQLLKDTAWEGKLPVNNLTVSLKVVNYPAFVLPETGSHGFSRMVLALGVCLMTATAALWYIRKED